MKEGTGVLLEHVISQNDKILEAVSSMQEQVKHIPIIREDIEELKSDMKTVKAAVTATNRDFHDLKQRVSLLEAT